jgi:hypothetical protein
MKSGDWAAAGASPPVAIASGDARTITNASKARDVNWKVTKPNHNRVCLLTDPTTVCPASPINLPESSGQKRSCGEAGCGGTWLRQMTSRSFIGPNGFDQLSLTDTKGNVLRVIGGSCLQELVCDSEGFVSFRY